MRLLLVDSQVNQDIIKKFLEFKQENIDIIIYDSVKQNTEILFIRHIHTSLISLEKQSNKFESIGWAFHGYRTTETYSLFDNNDYIIDISQNSSFENSKYWINILKYLKTISSVNGRVDIFLCNIFEEPMKKLFIHLEKESGINLAGSNNITGYSTKHISDWV